MIRAFKIGLMIELTNRKNMFSILIVMCIVFGCMFYIKSQAIGDGVVEKRADFYSAQAALSKFQVVDASENGDGSDLYKNLNQQKSAVALQIATLKFEQPPLYFETSLRIADLREKAFDLEEYEKVADLYPSRIKNTMNQLYYTFLVEDGSRGIQEPLHYFPFLLYFFSLIGAWWYVFISFYTSSILLDDFEHSSLIKGFPIRFDQYIFTKCITAFLYILSFIVVIFICALPLLRNGQGDARYPVAIYNGEPALYTTLQYIGIGIFYMLLISIFVMLFSIILNVLLKNMYLTLFVHVILFSLPTMFPALIQFIPYNPFHFMNFNQVLRGVPLELTVPVDITMNVGVLVISISIGIMLFIIKTFFSTGKITRT